MKHVRYPTSGKIIFKLLSTSMLFDYVEITEFRSDIVANYVR